MKKKERKNGEETNLSLSLTSPPGERTRAEPKRGSARLGSPHINQAKRRPHHSTASAATTLPSPPSADADARTAHAWAAWTTSDSCPPAPHYVEQAPFSPGRTPPRPPGWGGCRCRCRCISCCLLGARVATPEPVGDPGCYSLRFCYPGVFAALPRPDLSSLVGGGGGRGGSGLVSFSIRGDSILFKHAFLICWEVFRLELRYCVCVCERERPGSLPSGRQH